jgi:uncharacterized protein (DUF302 family)
MEMSSPGNGIISLPSPYSVEETIARSESLLKTKGMTIFSRIDQKAAAQQVGLEMRPTQILIFGDPKAGTPLMDAYPFLALDLPLKALVWEDAAGNVWLSYNSPAYLQLRHGLPETPFASVGALMEKALE